MLENIVNILDGPTAKILLVLFVAFAFYVIVEFRGHIKSTFQEHKVSIKESTKKFEKDFEKVQYSLAQHSSDMDKAQKKMEGESLRLREDLLTAQVGINEEINKTKIGIVKLNKSLEFLGNRVGNYQETLESSHGKIIHMEKHLKKNQDDIGKVLEVLETVKEDYGRIKVVAEKGKRTAEETKKVVEGHRETIEKVQTIFARAEKKKGKNGI